MLQNPVHVVTHLAQNKLVHYFSFLNSHSQGYLIFFEKLMFLIHIFAIPSYIAGRNSDYDNKGDE